MMEIWKDIEGYEGRYRVSNLGNVKSLNWRGTGIARNLVNKKRTDGYLQVILYGNGKRKMATVHRLVATAFVENPLKLPVINHKDENKSNNEAENLEWCTQKRNCEYFYSLHPEKRRKGGQSSGKSAGTYGAYKHFCPVIQMDKAGNVVNIWETVSYLARATGWNASSIVGCCKGKRKTAYGYIWQFVS